MNFVTLDTGSNEYKLFLSSAEAQSLEHKLGGKNPAFVFMGGGMENITVTYLKTVIMSALQFHHKGTKSGDVDRIFDEYVANGNSYLDLLPVLTELFQMTGFLPRTEAPTN